MTNAERLDNADFADDRLHVAPAGTLFDIYSGDGSHEAEVRGCGVEDALILWALEALEHGDDRLVMVPQGWGAREYWYRVERSLDDIRIRECAE